MYTYRSTCTVPIAAIGFIETWIFSIEFWKILKYQLVRKSFQWELNCCMRTDRNDKANCHLPIFRKCSQKYLYLHYKLLYNAWWWSSRSKICGLLLHNK
jgi:hypothetical protein